MLCRGIACEMFDLIGEVCALVSGFFRPLLERPRLVAAVGKNLQELGDGLRARGSSPVGVPALRSDSATMRLNSAIIRRDNAQTFPAALFAGRFWVSKINSSMSSHRKLPAFQLRCGALNKAPATDFASERENPKVSGKEMPLFRPLQISPTWKIAYCQK